MGVWNRLRVNRHNIVPISGGVQSSLTIKYDVRQLATTTLEIKYNLRNLVSDTLEVVYGVRNIISDTLEVIYNVNGSVRDTLKLIWSIIAPAITASFKQATHFGSELETIEEMPPLPRTAIISSTGFHISADLKVPESTALHTQASLKVPNIIPIHASSESLMKREFVGVMTADLKVSNQIPVKMEAKFKVTQPIATMKAEISFAPLYCYLFHLQILQH
ncbi:unnamed protein product, partial [marine sediment metagenome]